MRMPAAVLLPLFAVAGAVAQDSGKAPPSPVKIHVGDLTEPPAFRAPPEPVSCLPSSRWVLIPGFESPLEAGRVPLADPGDLVDAILMLIGGESFDAVVAAEDLLVPPGHAPAVSGALSRIRARRPSDFSVSLVLEEAADGGWRTLLAVTEPVHPVVPLVFVDARERAVLQDFDVELAQDSQLPDPIVDIQRTGTSLYLRILPLPRGDAAVIEAVARVSAPLPTERAETGYAEMASLDRGAMAAAEAALVFRVSPGVESVHAWQGRDGRFLRLRLTTLWSPPTEDPGPGVVLWSPLLSFRPPDRAYAGHELRPAGSEAEEDSVRFGRAIHPEGPAVEDRLDRVKATLGETVSFNAGATGGGLVVFEGARAREAAEALTGAMDAEFRSFRFEAEVRHSPPGGGEGGKNLLVASGTLVPGIAGYLRSGEARCYVQDWDVEVAQGSWIPDPLVDVLQTGDFLNLRLVGDGAGGIAAVDLDLQMARFEGIEFEEIPILNALDRSGGSPSGTAAGTPRRTSYRIEKPSVREVRITGRYPLRADGTVTLRRTVPGFLGGAGEVVVTLKVK